MSGPVQEALRSPHKPGTLKLYEKVDGFRLELCPMRSTLINCTHWGQRVVYRAGTLQIHCKDMDKVPTIY